MSAALVFVAMFALDFVWAWYTRAINVGHAVTASIYASAITLLGGAAIIGYAQEPWLLAPAMVGAFAGTFVALKTMRGA